MSHSDPLCQVPLFGMCPQTIFTGSFYVNPRTRNLVMGSDFFSVNTTPVLQRVLERIEASPD